MRLLPLVFVFGFALALSAQTAAADVETLMRNGHWKRARQAAEEDYREHSKDAAAAYRLGRARHAFLNLEEAINYGELAVSLDPKVDAYHRALGEAYEDQIGHVSLFKQLGYSRRIRAELDAASAIAPKDPDNLNDQINYLLYAPAIAGGDKGKAAQLAGDLVQIDRARGYLALARIARERKEEDKLEGFYQEAVKANPQNYEARLALATFYFEPARRNLALTERHAKAAIELNPDRIGGYRWLASALASQRRFDETTQVLSRAEATISDDLSPYVYAGRALLRDAIELPRAESFLQKYLTETKEPEAGAPLLAGAHWSLGLVYEKEGRLPDAKSELETALRLKPDFQPARKDLDRLKQTH